MHPSPSLATPTNVMDFGKEQMHIRVPSILPATVEGPEVEPRLDSHFDVCCMVGPLSQSDREKRSVPFDRLPFGLVPSPQRKPFQPPVVHFGWILEIDILLDYVERHNIHVEDTKYNFLPNGERLCDVDVPEAMGAALRHMAKRRGLQLPYTALRVATPIRIEEIPTVVVVSLYTNYTLGDIPSDFAIAAMAQELGIDVDTTPQWYFCCTSHYWRRCWN
ncbi:hypothetical protein A0H81_10897 [Grifola frondosa]|uniref:Uncharacterized protein n=1 Tax=Grifola frondosa TaxID=5627 RepID=A0A1C7M254_GRIFR|nr:hypothetical protein A0H81_10897 [Grifola frondosa]